MEFDANKLTRIEHGVPEIGQPYMLTIISREYNEVFKKQSYTLKNAAGLQFYGRSDALYQPGDQLLCTVESFMEGLDLYRVSIPRKANKSKQMVRTSDKNVLKRKNEDLTPLKKKARKYVSIFEQYHLHRCGKSETCRCCGKIFEKNKGYRVEIKDWYFCTDCKKIISSYIPKKKGQFARFISTPMGGQPK